MRTLLPSVRAQKRHERWLGILDDHCWKIDDMHLAEFCPKKIPPLTRISKDPY
jgi:hypothetical protein